MSGHARLDKVRHENIREKVGVVLIEDKLWEGRLWWFGYVKYRHTEAPVRQVEHIGLEVRKKRKSRPKLTWRRVVQHNLEALYIFEDLTQNCLEWRKRIHVADSNKFLR